MSEQEVATVDWCDPNASPLIDRLRMHAVEMNGDGCWRDLLNEARAEIATLDEEVALLREVVRTVAQALGDPLHFADDRLANAVWRALRSGRSER